MARKAFNGLNGSDVPCMPAGLEHAIRLLDELSAGERTRDSSTVEDWVEAYARCWS